MPWRAVNYEPWLKKLKLSTSGSKLADGGKTDFGPPCWTAMTTWWIPTCCQCSLRLAGPITARWCSWTAASPPSAARTSPRHRYHLRPALFAGEVAGEDEEGLSMVSEAQTSWVEAAGGDEEGGGRRLQARGDAAHRCGGSMLPPPWGWPACWPVPRCACAAVTVRTFQAIGKMGCIN